MHVAAEAGEAECLELLLDFGASADQQDKNGNTACVLCAASNNADCLKALLDAGAYPDLSTADGYSPLLLATQDNHHECVERIIEAPRMADRPSYHRLRSPSSYHPLQVRRAAHRGGRRPARRHQGGRGRAGPRRPGDRPTHLHCMRHRLIAAPGRPGNHPTHLHCVRHRPIAAPRRPGQRLRGDGPRARRWRRLGVPHQGRSHAGGDCAHGGLRSARRAADHARAARGGARHAPAPRRSAAGTGRPPRVVRLVAADGARGGASRCARLHPKCVADCTGWCA